MLPRRPNEGQPIPIHGRQFIAAQITDAGAQLLAEIVHLSRYSAVLGVRCPRIAAAAAATRQAIESIDRARLALTTGEAVR